MKNYYIVIPVTDSNVSQVFTFIAGENQNFLNSGGNRVFEIIPNPKSFIYPAYRIELKEELLSKTWVGEFDFETYLQAFTRLDAEIYESSNEYLLAYPPIKTK